MRCDGLLLEPLYDVFARQQFYRHVELITHIPPQGAQYFIIEECLIAGQQQLVRLS